MLCQVCKQNPATVHVTEIKQEVNVPALGGPAGGPALANPSLATPTLGGPIAAGPVGAGPAHGQEAAGLPSLVPTSADGKGAGFKVGANGAGPASSAPPIQEQHFCEPCAHAMKLPYGTGKNSVQDILKLIKAAHPPRTRAPGGLACPDCGITLVEFRQRGRLGCPKDYEVFGAQLRDLLERIHGSSQHVGRAPSADDVGEDAAVKRMQRITELRAALDAAIRDEAYEAAAKLRDELRTLQKS